MIPGDKDKSIYLASPYTDAEARVVNQRHRDICKVAGEMMRMGKVVFSPIAHTHEISRICMLESKWGAFWKKQCMKWVEACDEFGIVQLPGWSTSVGMASENQYAERLGKPIIYIDPQPWLDMK